MRRAVIVIVAVALVGAGIYFYRRGEAAAPGGGPGGMPMRPPMTVQIGEVTRTPLSEHITIVGNLVGNATVDVVPKVSGRLSSVRVRIGDTVAQGQPVATLEDAEIREQVRQAEASADVGQATIRQREADLALAKTNLDRARSLFGRQLISRQQLDEAEASHQAAQSQLELARAQAAQSSARLQELRITLENTIIRSPIAGYVGARFLDQGAFASTNQPVISVVAIHPVRLVASLVERDFQRVQAGTPAEVQVDAFPGEQFSGLVGRVAPVFDPQTRTAQMEIEVPNPGGRLKPGMYARVTLRVADKTNALTVPRNAVIDRGGERLVFVADGDRARQRTVQTGIEAPDRIEILSGVAEGERIVTIGAGALNDGDPIVVQAAGSGRTQ